MQKTPQVPSRERAWARRSLWVLAVLAALALADYLLDNHWSPKLQTLNEIVPFSDIPVPSSAYVDDVVGKWMTEMTLKEKCDLLRGSVDTKGYTGFVPGIARLGIPSLRMNDGPQGFRGPKKTSTAWPCGLSMATTFWPELVFLVARANGEEFLKKGSNVFLGPGMNMARIARNGRTFEYLAGEDPLLGEVMAATYIKGIQSNVGLIATAKHYVNNEQETDRTRVSATVDDETEWNMYYRPFKASVDAGVESIMCSYNRVNGKQSCASDKIINKDLKGTMNFKGFVMSDWFALTGTVETAVAGTDMEMPIPLYYGDAMKKAVDSGTIAKELVDDKVKRVLTTMVRRNITEANKLDPTVNVTSVEHARLARHAASHSVVLLKNSNNLLPLPEEGSLKILVIGDRAQEHVLATGGGSGHVHPPYVISPLHGLRVNSRGHTIEYANTVQAMGFPREAFAAADIVIAVVGTSSTEGLDRSTLALDPAETDMIKTAASGSSKVIVSVTAPGVVLLPFFDNVSGVLFQFMPGQEAGNALADVIFGRVDPGGARLPITIPNRDNERNMTKKQYPGTDYQQDYSEKTEIGYRWYVAHQVKPHLPFGYGLSYANIKFLGMSHHREKNGDFVFHAGFINTSNRPGVVVPQIYITRFPEAATKVVAPIALGGFKRLEMRRHDVRIATIHVPVQALKVWTKEQQDYILFPGNYEFSVGSNSLEYWNTVSYTL